MTLRDRFTKACGRPVCDEAAELMASCSTDLEYYGVVKTSWLMWGAAHRENAVARDIFAKAFKRYPSSDAACQSMVEDAETASPGRLHRIHHNLKNHCRDHSEDQFARAAVRYVSWLIGGSPGAATKITTALERHSGDKAEFGTWLRTELTFEIWSRGIKD